MLILHEWALCIVNILPAESSFWCFLLPFSNCQDLDYLIICHCVVCPSSIASLFIIKFANILTMKAFERLWHFQVSLLVQLSKLPLLILLVLLPICIFLGILIDQFSPLALTYSSSILSNPGCLFSLDDLLDFFVQDATFLVDTERR